MLVLQNVFDKTFLKAYRNNFTTYINTINSDRISAERWTSNRENFYMYMIDDPRWDVVLPRAFSHLKILTNPRVMEVLMEDVILKDDLSLHSLKTGLAEPGANAQAWHHDASYIFLEFSLQTNGMAGHDLPA